MSGCACFKPLAKFDTDAVVSALKGIRDLVQPSAEGRELDMVSSDDFYALLDLVLTHLEEALRRERQVRQGPAPTPA